MLIDNGAYWWNDQTKRNIMKNYVYKDKLLGPIIADKIDDSFAKTILFEYYDSVYKERQTNPSFIVGRRGSGKTAYLDHLDLSGRYSIVIKLKKDKLIEEVILWINQHGGRKHFVESINDYWNTIIYSLICAEILREYPNIIEPNSFIRKFINSIHVISNGSAVGFVKRLLHRASLTMKEKAGSGDLISALFVDFIDSIDEPHVFLREKIDEFCAKHKIKVAVLIDSLERYNLDETDIETSLEGFLKSVGSHSGRFKPQIKCCIPSEIYYHFRGLSSNIDKDFVSNPVLFLHWKPIEILSLIAHRMIIHIRLYGDGDARLNRQLLDVDLSNRDGVRDFFRLSLGENLINECGTPERPETFILRHTQMTPRHALGIFNSILSINVSENKQYAQICTESVIKGTYSVINDLADGVCAAYKYQYPKAWAICRDMVSRLPDRFGHADIESLYRRYIKARPLEKSSVSELSISRMLIEIGCIGVIVEDTNQYTNCQFEYNSRPEIIPPYQGDEIFCVHPMFRGPLSRPSSPKAVYPVGCDPYSVAAMGS